MNLYAFFSDNWNNKRNLGVSLSWNLGCATIATEEPRSDQWSPRGSTYWSATQEQTFPHIYVYTPLHTQTFTLIHSLICAVRYVFHSSLCYSDNRAGFIWWSIIPPVLRISLYNIYATEMCTYIYIKNYTHMQICVCDYIWMHL